MTLSKLQEEDFKKYFVEKGDPGFNPKHNKALVEQTIADAEILWRKKKREWINNAGGERIDAVASYLKSPKVGKNVEAYFGKKELARLRGMEILQELKDRYLGRSVHKVTTFSNKAT